MDELDAAAALAGIKERFFLRGLTMAYSTGIKLLKALFPLIEGWVVHHVGKGSHAGTITGVIFCIHFEFSLIEPMVPRLLLSFHHIPHQSAIERQGTWTCDDGDFGVQSIGRELVRRES